MKNEILLLMEFQKERSTLIKMMNAQRSQIVSYIARCIGYNSYDDETERKQKWGQAEKINAAITKKTPIPEGFEEIAERVESIVLTTDLSMQGLVQRRKSVEVIMAKLAGNLPVAEWWTAHKGLNVGGLAKIVGEAGNLDDYENPAKLWKRFGLAVIDGFAQGKLPRNTPAEVWIEHGYCKRRRSEIWQVYDALFKSGGKDNPYRAMYDSRKAYEIERLKKAHIEEGKTEKSFKPGRAHNRALRYCQKHLLKALWCQWTGKDMD